MPKFLNLAGQKFGRLTVINLAEKGPRAWWHCKCDCGTEKIVSAVLLRSGGSKSCGCLKKETDGKHRIKHGHAPTVGKAQSPTYATWRGMKLRCLNPNHSGYKDYGARGITICERWMDFENFLEDMGVRPENQELERKDTNGNYCKENCVWTTHKENCRNMRSNIMIEFECKSLCLAEWAEITGLSWVTLYLRLFKLGWSVKDALEKPIKKFTKEPPNDQ